MAGTSEREIADRERERQRVANDRAAQKAESEVEVLYRKAARKEAQAKRIREKGAFYQAQSDEATIARLTSRDSFLRRMGALIRDHQDYELSPATYNNALKALRYLSRRCKSSSEAGRRAEVEITIDDIAQYGTRCNARDTRDALRLLQGHPVKAKTARKVNGKRVKQVKLRGIVAESGKPLLHVANGGRNPNRYWVDTSLSYERD